MLYLEYKWVHNVQYIKAFFYTMISYLSIKESNEYVEIVKICYVEYVVMMKPVWPK